MYLAFYVADNMFMQRPESNANAALPQAHTPMGVMNAAEVVTNNHRAAAGKEEKCHLWTPNTDRLVVVRAQIEPSLCELELRHAFYCVELRNISLLLQ